ncbi:cytochrome P450 6k1 isoform X2 [Diachasma alloeum]|uniref:cytochrome P450 6k1 isoform X2 n=1 Tax=Diachasma alloeum TaxID=454923 RepID=UPI00073815DA|nr:cytochrome P450 6k1 isoform X2 [Diachasma alloeum]
MALTLEILLTITAILTALYYYLTSTFDYWKFRGIPGPKPVPIFGTMKEIFLTRMSMGTYVTSIYRDYAGEPLVGIYQSRRPMLVVNDLELIKNIMIKDFSKFVDRGTSEDKYDPLSANLVSLAPEKWRPLRAKLSPVFTSGKLKDMFHLLVQCSNEFERYLEGINYESVDIRDICGKYTTDVIGVCAFGLQANSMRDGDSIFRVMGMRIFNPNFKQLMKGILQFNFPTVYNIVGRYLQDHELINFFLDLTKDTMNYRRKNHLVRHDFVDLLMKIKDDKTVEDIEITDELLAAQLFIFFGGGFETSAGAISNTLFELALNPSVQEKLREEIHETLATNGGKMTYQSIKRMEYLDSVIKGSRFALVQVKAGLITVLKSYAVEVCEKTDKNYEIDEKAFLLIPKNGIFLNMKKLMK